MLRVVLVLAVLSSLTACATIKLGPSYDEPLKQQVVKQQEGAQAKVLIIQISGTISDQPGEKLLGAEPSLLDKVMMQLAAAEKDPAIKTVLLKINSPGGAVTTSDILYHELIAFKQRTGKKIYVQMMDVAASGGYYISMAADHIQAHPTTITGSVGVITILPEVSGLADKIGVKVHTFKSGVHKDTGSPFRPFNQADKAEFEKIISEMAQRFHSIVQQHRNLSDEAMKPIKTAKVYTGKTALTAGLIDSTGYLTDALDSACQLAGAEKCEVVTYRFDRNVNATVYSPNMGSKVNDSSAPVKLIDSGLLDPALSLQPGNYYLYLP